MASCEFSLKANPAVAWLWELRPCLIIERKKLISFNMRSLLLRLFFIFLTTSLLFSIPLNAAVIDAVWNYVTDIPIASGSYTATGNEISLTLNCVPTANELTVIKNTGPGFIEGAFINLAQGQSVALVYSGSTYNFVANYHGGNGNDLVLAWAGTRAFAWGANTYGQLGDNTKAQRNAPVAVSAIGTNLLFGKTVLSVASGGNHSLALCSDGTLATWGYNYDGELGNNSSVQSRVPVTVNTSAGISALAGKTVVAVAAGELHSLALCSDGSIAAWGCNYDGELGDGSAIDSLVPVAVNTDTDISVLAGKTVTAVASGQAHNLALCSDGTLAAWGYNGDGELGDGNTTDQPVPVAVSTAAGSALSGKTVVAVAAGADHSLALCSDGVVVAWGDNSYGQLGNNSTIASPMPVTVNTTTGISALAGKTVVAIAAGAYHSLALCSDGSLVAWGSNYNGQIGDNTLIQRMAPAAVFSGTGSALLGRTVVSIRAGQDHSVAQCSDGSVIAWGGNYNGQLGDNTTAQRVTPIAVTSTALAAGERFVMANSGCAADHTQALVASVPPAVPIIAVEQPAGCAVANGGTVDFGSWVVGSPVTLTFSVRNLGTAALTGLNITTDGTNSGDFVVATRPMAPIAPGGATTFSVLFASSDVGQRIAAIHIANNDLQSNSFTINLTGTAVVIGCQSAVFNSPADIPVTADSYTATSNSISLSLNCVPSCNELMVIKNTGLDFINGTFANLAQGQAVSLSYAGVTYNFVANYYGGTGNDLVLVWAGTHLVAWGNNGNGELGDNTTTNRSTPVAVTGTGVLLGKTVVAMAEGDAHSLALCADGVLVAWGLNDKGQLGDNTTTQRNLPVIVETGSTSALYGKRVVAISAGTKYSLALCADGSVVGWGYNSSGQLGNSSTTDSILPVAVNSDSGSALFGKSVCAIAAGSAHCLALRSDGTVVAWGLNSSGQIGDNSTLQHLVPFAVNVEQNVSSLFGKRVVAIAAGSVDSFALCSNGTVVGWGVNTFGELGDGSATQHLVPVAVKSGSGSALLGKTVIEIAAGGFHTMGLCTDGSIAAWGNSYWAQLGSESGDPKIPLPVKTGTDSALYGKTVIAISAGANNSFALCSDGAAIAWGRNSYGGIGDGTGAQRGTPVTVKSGSMAVQERFTRISSGCNAEHALAMVGQLITPPTTTTLSATGVGTAGATLNGSVGAAGNFASVYFEYGTTTAYGSSIPAAQTPISAINAIPVTANLIGLVPGTTYHFRVVVVISGITFKGQDQSFTTQIASLSNLVLSTGTLSPAFSAGTMVYSCTVANTVSSTKVTPTVHDANATVRVNGSVVSSGIASGTIPLSVGANPISIVVTAGDGTPGTYTVVVNRLPSANAVLVSLTLSAGTPAPLFSSGIASYHVDTSFGTTSTTITPVTQDPTATVTINGCVAPSGSPSDPIPLEIGDNLLSVVVTAQDGTTISTCTVTVTRAAQPQTVAAAFNLPLDIPLTVSSYTAAGNTVNLSLNCVPSCNELMVIKNTGPDFIHGEFDNLAQGQTVSLSYGGLTYNFVANYYGGNGNDLVLAWAGTRTLSWGGNSSGGLGDNSTTGRLTPVAVVATGTAILLGKTVLSVAAGGGHSLALCSDGAVAAWGSNVSGQLGDNTTTDRYVPEWIEAGFGSALFGKRVVALDGGSGFSLALCSDGTVLAWGINSSGQLGDSTTAERHLPGMVNAGSRSALYGKTVVSISAGASHSLALCSDGTVMAWGLNSSGQLGDNSTTERDVPVAVNTALGVSALFGKTVVAVSAGLRHSLALCSDGAVAAWGHGYYGELGEGTVAQHSAPVAVDTGTTSALSGKAVVAVAAGADHSISLCSNGAVVAWGVNSSGQLGDTTYTQRNVPTAVDTVEGVSALYGKTVVAIAAGESHSAALCSDGDLATWGNNFSGQLGNGESHTNSKKAVAVHTPLRTEQDRFTGISNGINENLYGHSLALVASTAKPPAPFCSILPVEDLTLTTVCLKSAINALGYDTTVTFSYGSDGLAFPNQIVMPGTFKAWGDVVVSTTVTGLTKGTQYYYRLTAASIGGITLSDTASFITRTEPTGAIGAATPVSTTSVQVTGTINARGSDTQVFFDYGFDPANLIYSVQAAPALATGYTDIAASAVLTNIQQATTYYYRLRGTSLGGVGTSGTGSFQLATLSGVTRVLPDTPPDAQGYVFVTLIPSGIASGWRFKGEQQWRASGVPVGGLTTGDREIEYRPVPGYIQPMPETVSVVSGGEATLVTGEYYDTPGGTAGGLGVVLKPDSLADPAVPVAQRAQWRLLGEDDTQWRDTGVTLDGLVPGVYLVECKPVSGRTTPSPMSVPVQDGQTVVATATYYLASVTTGTQPSVLSFDTVTAGGALPYAYVGQIRSDVGSATGFVVKPRVVATAAHVVFDDGSLSYVTGLQWLFQRDRGTYEPVPQVPRGFYVFEGYATQRTTEGTPGISSPQSQNLDIAAMYFLEDAGRGGYGGYLASDLDNNEYLLSSKLKMLVGYPVDGIAASRQGRMHATPAANVTFALAFGRTFTTSDIRSAGGNSGGPLCVQADNGNYYPAAIYLGGSGQTVVRAIDSAIIDLFSRAEVSGNGGGNSTGGGITQVNTTLSGGAFSAASLKVTIVPAAAVTAGAKWKLGSSTTLWPSGQQTNNLSPANYSLGFTAATGFLTPSTASITLTGGNLSTVTRTYYGITTQPVGKAVNALASATFTMGVSGTPSAYQWRRNGINIAGATAASYTRSSLSVADSGNYTVVVTWGTDGSLTSSVATLDVNALAQSISFAAPSNRLFGAPALTLGATASSGLPVTFSLISGPATLNGNVLTPAGCGAVTVRASQAGNGYYDPAVNVDHSFSICGFMAQPQAQAVNALADITFSVAVSGAPTAYQWMNNGTPIAGATNFTFTRTRVTAADAGDYSILVTWGATGSLTSTAARLDVNALAQSISFAALSDRLLGAPALTLSATASSGLPIAFELVSGPATLNGNLLTPTGYGTVAVRANQAGDGNFDSAVSIERSFQVTGETPESWRCRVFTTEELANPQLSGPAADFDRDGISNLMEFALNLDPKSAGRGMMIVGSGTGGLPLVRCEKIGGQNRLTVEYVRRTSASTPGITYTVEFTSTLSNAAAWSGGGDETVTPIDATWERVKVIDPQSASPNRFSRLKITQP